MNLLLSILIAFFAVSTLQADEIAQQVLDEINLARTQPQQYAQILAANVDSSTGSRDSRALNEAIRFLQGARPASPLSWSPGIGQAALSHTLDLGPRGKTGHTGARGETPWKRMSRFGKFQGYAGENIAYGHREARAIVIALIVDSGVPSRLHRTNIFNRAFRVTGIAVGPHANYGSMCVMDFASGYFEAGDERIASRSGPGLRSMYSGMSFF